MNIPSIPSKHLQFLQIESEESFPPIVTSESLNQLLLLKQKEHKYSVFVESKILLQFDVSTLKSIFDVFSIELVTTTLEYIKSAERCVIRSHQSVREALLVQQKLENLSVSSTIGLTENE